MSKRIRVLLRLRLPDEPSTLTSRLFGAVIQAFRAAKKVDPKASMRIERDNDKDT